VWALARLDEFAPARATHERPTARARGPWQGWQFGAHDTALEGSHGSEHGARAECAPRLSASRAACVLSLPSMASQDVIAKLAFGAHSRSGAPALVDTVYEQVLEAQHEYRKTADALDVEVSADTWCYGILLMLVCFAVQLAIGVYNQCARSHVLSWTIGTIIWSVPLFIAWTEQNRTRLLIRTLVYRALAPPTRTNMTREERIKRALDQPINAAVTDRFGSFLAVGDSKSSHAHVLKESPVPWTRAPTSALVEKLHGTLASNPEFASLSADDQQRALALAVVDVCLFGEH